jgi:molybdenum cofactor biosynthesis enzyme MoaA
MSAFATRRTIGSPVQLIHFVTSKCNFACKHCFYWQELNQKKNELTLEEIKKMSPSIGPIFFLLIGGGEPFIRQDLPEIIKTYYENNGIQNLSIPTNGSLIKKTVGDCEKILAECPGLKFSLSL